MNEIEREHKDGLTWEYLGESMKKKTALEGKQLTPMPSLMGQMFAVFAKTIIEAVGEKRGRRHRQGRRTGVRADAGQTHCRKGEGPGT